MIFQQKLFVKVLFHCQSDQSGQGPASQLVLTFGKFPECGVTLAQGFSLIKKWTFAVVIITQLLLYSHFFKISNWSQDGQGGVYN